MIKKERSMKSNHLLMQVIVLVALVATLGSLYFSEIRAYAPCEMCWYQRIIMYPMALMSLISVIRKEMNIAYYLLLFSSIGIIAAIYHYSLQKLPVFTDLNMCTGVSCTVQYINWFGFITIPFLALIANIIIFVCSIIIIKNLKKGRITNGK